VNQSDLCENTTDEPNDTTSQPRKQARPISNGVPQTNGQIIVPHSLKEESQYTLWNIRDSHGTANSQGRPKASSFPGSDLGYKTPERRAKNFWQGNNGKAGQVPGEERKEKQECM